MSVSVFLQSEEAEAAEAAAKSMARREELQAIMANTLQDCTAQGTLSIHRSLYHSLAIASRILNPLLIFWSPQNSRLSEYVPCIVTSRPW